MSAMARLRKRTASARTESTRSQERPISTAGEGGEEPQTAIQLPETSEEDEPAGQVASSDDEAPEDLLWVTGKDQALEQKRLEAAAARQ